MRTHTAVPDPAAIRPFSVPESTVSELTSGLPLEIVVLDRLPLVSVQLVLDVGEVSVPADRAGIAALTGATLQGGAGERTGEELAEALESIGAGIAVRPGWDATRISLSCLPERLPEALGLLADVSIRPTFPESEVARSRDQRLAQVDHELSDPRSLGNQSAARLIFAEGEPFGRRAGGSRETVAPLDHDSVREFHARHYGPAGGCLIVTGDVDVGEVRALTEERFGSWAPRVERPSRPECRPRKTSRHVWIVRRPGAVQSEIRIGHVGVARSTPDYFALRIFNAVLGGTFTSRLNLNLRERNGFTYGVRSQFAARRAPGPFTIATAVETAVTADAVREAISEAEGLVRDGPDAEEVGAARDYLAGVFPLQWETTGQVAARIADRRLYDLAEDYWRTYRDHIRAVDPQSAHAAGRRHVRPEEAQIVVVGDPEQVAAPLEALDLGPVSVVEPR